jgi:zinc D-Ala-D-Ala carboxypeptidase
MLQKCLRIAQSLCNIRAGGVEPMNTLTPRGLLAAALVVATLTLAACAPAEVVTGTVRATATPLTSPTVVITEDDGFIAVGESVSAFDEQLPAIANLEPTLRAAVQAAVTDAERDGIVMVVSSGWRSAAYQQALLDDAVARYGSREEARKRVSTPELSHHVTGNAVDIGYTDADSWLSQHGARYGLCQIYANEMWHFELATDPGGVCPEQKLDAAG